jgi:hypothetical protein
MPRTCTRDGCNAAVSLVDDNGVTDPRMDRLETYECEYGHEFTVRLEGRA